MIIMHNQGRLGNQMFQFAFAYSLSRKNGCAFVFDRWDRLSYFELYEKYRWNNTFKRFMAGILFGFGKLLIKHHMSINKYDSELLYSFSKNRYYFGFYQSSSYFNDYKAELIRLFRIRAQYQCLPRNGEYAAIHMRFGDYKDLNSKFLGSDISLNRQYFEKGYELLKKEYKVILIVSDDKAMARKYCKGWDVTIHDGNEMQDFQVLLNANALWISNSTFSWWAAYLNKKNCPVYAPKFWMGSNIQEVYPENIFDGLNWNLIETT